MITTVLIQAVQINAFIKAKTKGMCAGYYAGKLIYGMVERLKDVGFNICQAK